MEEEIGSSTRASSSHQVVVDVDHDDGEDDDVPESLNHPKGDDEQKPLMEKSSSQVNITSNIAASNSTPTTSIVEPSSANGTKSKNGTAATGTNVVLKTKSSLASGSKTSPGKVSISLKTPEHKPSVNQESPKIKRQSILLKRGDTDLSIDHTGLQRLLPSFMQFAFADSEAEAIYREYYSNEKRSDFHILIKILLLTNVVLLSLFTLTLILPPSSSSNTMSPILSPLVSYDSQDNMIPDRNPSKQVLPRTDLRETELENQIIDRTHILLICIISLLISLSLIAASGMLCSWTSTSANATKGVLSPSTSSLIWSILPILMWIIQLIHITCDLWLYPVSRLPSDSISWMLLYTYFIYVIFPLRLRFCVLLSSLLSLYHVILISTSPVQVTDFKSQLVSNVLLFICVNVLGIMSFFFYERQQRRSFLETCQSLEAKLVLEEESQEQVRGRSFYFIFLLLFQSFIQFNSSLPFSFLDNYFHFLLLDMDKH